ncbi:MAG: hypothetical protein KF878_37830 [Planctomycetes bacterium]|nr:hypothetical protein [Planctomycetota bacterium]
MGSRYARVALVLLNLALLSAIVFLVQHAVRRRPATAYTGPLPRDLAVEAGGRAAVADPSREIGEALDPPPPVTETSEVTPPPPVVDPAALAGRYRLLLVSEDRQDPERSTAIVASSSGGQQRTVMIGDDLDGYEVVALEVQVDGNERRALLVARRGDQRQELRTERSPRP